MIEPPNQFGREEFARGVLLLGFHYLVTIFNAPSAYSC
jgi:hypothetical protein